MKTLLGCLGWLFVIALALAFSYFITCGVVYLICLCFAWKFSWLVATGVWLILGLLGSIFNG
jgi:hypothetical protein